jgi:hypothetical protein
MSGRSNVTYWLEKRGLTATEDLVDRIFQKAKRASAVLTDAEILAEIGAAPGAQVTDATRV